MIRSRALSLVTAALLIAPQGAVALPPGIQVQGGPPGMQVQAGQATSQQNGNTLTINQASQNAIYGTPTFNIAPSEKVNVFQPGVSSNALFRVYGPGASQIYGGLWSNGRVYLINPYGILFGAGSQINTAGFLASTNDIKNSDFMAGNYKFNIPGRPDASIVNLGNIHITPSSTGFAALVAPGVRNAGTITANLGHVALASGNGFTLDFYGDKLITLQVGDLVAAKVLDVSTGQRLDSLVKNEGTLKANGGRVELTAAAARHVVDAVINNTGTIEANTVGTKNGMIVLGAATAGTKPADAPVQNVKIAGKIKASGHKAGQSGGTVVVTGEDIALTGAKINVSGQAGGGTALIGDKMASAVAVDSASVIDASAKSKGDGGKVIVLSDGLTSIAGLIRASGGPLGGNGGFVETSGQTVDFTGIRVNTSAPAGTTGMWLVDPTNLIINNYNVGTLTDALATTNVTLQTNAYGPPSGPGFRDNEGSGDIIINAPIAWSPTIGMTTLSLISTHDIQINQAITTTKGGLTLNAGNAINATAAVNVGTFTLQNGNWSQVSSKLPAFSATDFRLTGGTFLRAAGGDSVDSPYQIADVYGLQGISSPSGLLLNKNFALANNIDASGTANWNGGAGFASIGNGETNFTGSFNGQGNAISGLTIHSLGQYVGVFGYIGTGGVVRNLGLINANVTGTQSDGHGWVGALAGVNAGEITQSYATGSVSGAVSYDVGGLVARNFGTIAQSYTNVSTNGGNSSAIGGLVGNNFGSITQSYSLGPVNAGAGSAIGGLVGWNSSGTITQSYATGMVSAPSSTIGGLVGLNGGTVNSSYWDTQTTGQLHSAGSADSFGLSSDKARERSSYVGWNFSSDGGAWFMIDGQTRPFLQSEYSTTITNAHQLQLMSMNLDAKYTLANNINLGSALANPSDVWSKQGFVPIGQPLSPGTIRPFAGDFDGRGHTIDGLTIAPAVSGPVFTGFIGLFGANTGTIRNLNLTDVSVTADNLHPDQFQSIGTLAGLNAGTISNVHVSGQLNGDAVGGIAAGGLVGSNGFNFVFSNERQVAVPGVIVDSSAAVTVTLSGGSPEASRFAGGLVGFNAATIVGSSASGNVTVDSNSSAGGLVGANQTATTTNIMPSISDSFATGNVFSAGINVNLGGLVGMNDFNSVITNSRASGNVTSTANIPNQSGGDCSLTSSCQSVSVGGLVGFNEGGIVGQTLPSADQGCGGGVTCASGAVSAGANGQAGGLVGSNSGIIFQAFGTGAVHVGANGQAGGLVGFNNGTIQRTFATGTVTGDAGVGIGGDGFGRQTTLGGLAGNNLGVITDSLATGNVGGIGVAQLDAGGFVGSNSGTIGQSRATGNVSAGNDSSAGGFVADNNHSDSTCASCNVGIGQNDKALITNSSAIGAVTVGSRSVAGGFASSNGGTIQHSQASGAVIGGANSILGGFVAVTNLKNGFAESTIDSSTAFGSVTSTGANSVVGGFVGVNGGEINNSSSSGAVNGTSDSYLGGFVGTNVGAIIDSTATVTATVTGSGSNNFAGGFVGMNLGSIDPSTAAGDVSSGANSFVGSFAGANALFVNFVPGQIPGSSFPGGTISADSVGTGATSGGPGSSVGGQIGLTNPTTRPADPAIVNTCGDSLCFILQTGLLPGPPLPPLLPDAPLLPQVVQLVIPQLALPIQQVVAPINFNTANQPPVQINLTTGDTGGAGGNGANGGNGNNAGNKPPGNPPGVPPPGRGIGRTLNEQMFSGVPPLGETRFLPEIVLQISNTIPSDQVMAIAKQLGLTLIASQSFDAAGRVIYRFGTGGKDIRALIRALEQKQIVASAEPNYIFGLAQGATQPAAPAQTDQTGSIPPAGEPATDLANSDTASLTSLPAGDAAQYVIDKLHLGALHQRVRGRNVTVAVIDSEIDSKHPDLAGVIMERYDATSSASHPHLHGTGMAGAIASHQRLLGVAPGVRILAIKAFDESASSAEATSFQILKGLDYAISRNVRIINMSFAGPRDLMMERTLKTAYDKGIVLIAAAGNAGPKSAPLYPGADPSVIAVTATDYADKPFAMANRGNYIAVAAPGVDVMVPSPDGSYQLTTGTSVAAAHVSGVAALLLESKPTMTPSELRGVLMRTAKAITHQKDDPTVAGLVDPVGALQAVGPARAVETVAPGGAALH